MYTIVYKALSSHIRLFDISLGNAYKDLSLNDFTNPKGFEQSKHASDSLKAFYQLQNQLEYGVKHSIWEHTITDAQVRYFAHWLQVAQSLLKRGNHAGFFVVMICLTSTEIDNLKLSRFCKKKERQHFNELASLLDTSQNFANYRKYCSKGKQKAAIKVPAIHLVSRDLIYLNDQLGDNKLVKLSELKDTNEESYSTAKKFWQLIYDCINMQNKITKKELGPTEKIVLSKYSNCSSSDHNNNKLWSLNKDSKKRINTVIYNDDQSTFFKRKRLSKRMSRNEFNYSVLEREKSQTTSI